MRLRIASRKSDLARWQALQVARHFAALAQKPQADFIYKASLGDQDLDTPLANMGRRGVFTEDFYADLMADRCDLVVHSWKDLPVEPREGTEVAMTLARADMRDVLLVPEAVWQKASADGRLRILTSSPRRVYNLRQGLADLLPAPVSLEFSDVRGNVPTRLGKMHAQGRALVLAKAGLDRLLDAENEGFLENSVRAQLNNCRFMILPLSLNPCAAAQGALAVEIPRAKLNLRDLCAKLNDVHTFTSVQIEREMLTAYGGGCQQKIGIAILTRDYGQITSLRGITEQGETLSRWEITSSTPWPRARSGDQVFPLHGSENSWFERHPLKPTADFNSKQGLVISRKEALPSDYVPPLSQWMWTAGVKTWRHLAKRGIWVHGSYDGLGESEATGIDGLAGQGVEWTKLSHSRGEGADVVATYELKPKPQSPDLRGKTHFFWMSRSAFERGFELFPDAIRNGYNAAGPGHTFTHLSQWTELKNPPKVFIDLQQFLAETLPH